MAKEKVPRAEAEAVAAEIMCQLADFCQRWKIAGSIRRKKAEVSDIEIVYVPHQGERESTGDMFDSTKINPSRTYLKTIPP
jgi:DNA polymerase/3'-5' exonuclease PolX